MLEFEWPWMFLCLPVPALVYFLLPRATREEAALRTPFFQRAARALHQGMGIKRGQSQLNLLILCLIWIALCISSAKPQWVGESISFPASGRDLLVAVDISGSMETADMRVQDERIPRVFIVKYVVGEFLERRINDRLGLILFGTNAYLQSPLTFDRKTVNKLLQEAQLGFAGEKTAIGDAIGLAIKRLKDRPDSQRVLILLTDGANTAGEVAPRQAADLAKQANVKIYTIGIGAEEMVIRKGLFGTFDRRVNPSADLDEPTLQYIAETTGGKYFRARNPEELAKIYNDLDALEPVEQEEETYRPTSTLYFWPLGIGFILSLMLAIARSGLLATRTRATQ